jgi:dTMP kinase
MSRYPGKLISFEGAEAVGKSTQIKKLASALKKRGFDTYRTREPGGTVFGEKLRRLVKSIDMSSEAELFLLEASRTELVQKEILPRLKKGQIVLCDRFQESSLVYQGLMGSLSLKTISICNQVATQGLQSDLILWFDLSDSELKKRLKTRVGSQDRFDSREWAYHQKLLRAYRVLAKSQKKPKLHRLDANHSPEAIHSEVLKLVDQHLKLR